MRFNLGTLVGYAKYTIYSYLSVREVEIILQKRLSEQIVFTAGSGWLADTRHYSGTIAGNLFKLDGPFGDRKYTLVTRGAIASSANGSKIDLQMRPATWLVVSILLILSAALAFTLSANLDLSFSLVPMLAVYGVVMFGCFNEASIIARLFRDLLGHVPN